MTHSIVYANPEFYAGWPANHGAWQWGDEFLVGFLRGPYTRRNSMHRIAEPFERLLARSDDGGESWKVEKPETNFDGLIGGDSAPAFDVRQSLVRACGVYDTGGDYTDERGCFYLSNDRGKSWSGAWLYDGLSLPDDQVATPRTCVLDDLVFLSAGQRDIWGTDYTFCMRHDGRRFVHLGTVCEDDARAVMPAVARIGKRIVCVMRRRRSGKRAGWIDAYASEDEGATWRFLAWVGDTGSHNGNPPALVALKDGRLLCAFGNRDHGSIVGAVSADSGKTWESFLIRPSESSTVDIGYPRLFMRSDDVPVCVYYWSEPTRPQQHIAATQVSMP